MVKMEKLIEKYDCKYLVTSEGDVFSLKGNKKLLKGSIKNSGYREVLISHKNKKTYELVHRLVAKAFIENPNNLRTVNHKDGNKLNNHVSNLEWMSCSDNLKHARDSGLSNCKINMKIANDIRNENGSHREIANKYGIGKTLVGYIKQKKDGKGRRN